MSAVKIYKDSNFDGRSDDLNVGTYSTISSYVGNDNISSIRVSEGYYAQLYKDSGFRGDFITLFHGNYSELPGWNDNISSIKVFEHDDNVFPLVEFYQNKNFDGDSQTLAATGQNSEYMFPFLKNDSISSMRVPDGVTVILFDDKNLEGDQREFSSGDYDQLNVYGWNDKASSVQIMRPNLKLITTKYLNQIESPNGNPIKISSTTRNKTATTQKVSLGLSKNISESITQTWSESTLSGLSVTGGQTVGFEGGGVAANVTTMITSTSEDTFTIGENKSKGENKSFKKTVSVTIPPHTRSTATITLTPKKYTVNVEYTFQVEGTDYTTTQNAVITVEAYEAGAAVITSNPISS